MGYLNVVKAILGNRLGLFQRPSFVTYMVTWRCNAKCDFCDIWRRQDSAKEELTLDQIAHIFSEMPKLDGVRLTGGEPFLRKDLADVVNCIVSSSDPLAVHITSNGLLTDKVLDFVENITDARKLHLKISIDHFGEKHDIFRGVTGAFSSACKTVSELSRLRKKLGFHLGVNQAIVSEQGLEDYEKLSSYMKEIDVRVFPTIALESAKGLYSEHLEEETTSFSPLESFSHETAERIMEVVLRDSANVNDWKERLLNRYFLLGIKNRILYGRKWPNPKCVALRNHLRILPNGDVPICIHNSKVVGNLARTPLRTIWNSPEVKTARRWVENCSGCWEGCEVNLNAIYTGDLMKSLLYKK